MHPGANVWSDEFCESHATDLRGMSGECQSEAGSPLRGCCRSEVLVITSEYMATITLRIPDSMNQALDRQSAAQQISKSDLAREALRRFLVVTEFRALRAKMVPVAESKGIHTDDDVFDALKS